MKPIRFDEGYKEYMINDDPGRVIRLRLDPNMIERYEGAVARLEECEQTFGELDADNMSRYDSELRELINDAFGTDICTPAFGNASLFTPTSGGEVLFMAFFNSFLPELEKDIRAFAAHSGQDKTQVSPKVQKYLDEPAVKPGGGALPDVSGLTPEQKKQLALMLIS